jgi:hypothetical protein
MTLAYEVTRYGTIRIDASGDVHLTATADELDAWATRPGKAWPCSELRLLPHLAATFDANGDLVDLAGDDGHDITNDEFSAWVCDVAEAALDLLPVGSGPLVDFLTGQELRGSVTLTPYAREQPTMTNLNTLAHKVLAANDPGVFADAADALADAVLLAPRFALFAGGEHYPCGGFADFRGVFVTVEDAISSIVEDAYDWWHLVDLQTLQTVRHNASL